VGPRSIATLVLVTAGALPWLTVIARHGVLAVVAQVLTLVAAFHGAGQGIVRLTRRPPLHPLLAIQVGIAALIAVSGFAILFGIDRFAVQVVVVLACAGLHCFLLVKDASRYRDAIERIAAGSRIWMAPACLLFAIAFVHVLGAAGDTGARPFDDDGNVLAQLQRLRDTGMLGDPIGYPRHTQLGGQLALTALATVPGDVHLARVMESLAFTLSVGLALWQLRIAERRGALLGILLIAAATALPFVQVDPSTCWTAVGLILAVHTLLQTAKSEDGVPLALLVGALVTLRLELAPIAITGLVVTLSASAMTRKRRAILVAVAASVVVPFVLAKSLSGEPGHALLVDKRLPLLLALLVTAGTCIACAPVVVWTWRLERLRWYGVASSLAIAGIAGELTGDRPYALRFLWPVAFAGALILVIEAARAKSNATTMLLVALVLALLIHDGRTATGRRRWPRRYLDLIDNIEYLIHHGASAPVTASYGALLDKVPRGSVVGVWVTRPERLNYEAHRIVDLRTPRSAQLRTHRWNAHTSRLEKLARAAHVDVVLLERDDRRRQRIHDDAMYRLLCPVDSLACADDLELVALKYRVIAQQDGVQLIDLRVAR